MSNQQDFEQIARAAADPNVDLEYLRSIAASYPGLRPTIALNPAAYDELLTWLGSLRDPAVDAALAARRAGHTGATAAGTVAGAASAGHYAPQTQTGAPAGAAAGASVAGGAGVSGTAGSAGVAGEAGAGSAGAGFQPMPFEQVAGGAGVAAAAAGAAGNYNPEQGEGESKKKVWLIILLVLLAIALVLGLLFAFLRGSGSQGTDSDAGGVKPAATATPNEDENAVTKEEPTIAVETEDETPEASPEPTQEAPDRFPAPADAKEIPGFISPSQNIGCYINNDQAYCSIVTRDYAKEGAGACVGVFGMKVTKDGDAQQTCDDPAKGQIHDGLPTLDYGSSSKIGHFACSMERSGVTCWNMQTGKEFSMRRADFSSGQR
ncbi:hypothetical protein BK816_08230 [Boudabousia tangfeifanii]|uniref:Leucine rich repeat variant domain-containing protein n=1 Tax=Boudabousia tangfeifanii TaxID=1912795 RepID=A0A1D9MMA2_9ACTO|nr:hypothetical protein [Boudabousia tangfeifanii]AOZ73270.1 hypothetical protein BK816_08230 [Boudabousia tangfeifanii]